MTTTLKHTANDIMVRMVMDRWKAAIKTCDELIRSLSDGQLEKEISPGKNRGVYVLGHLVAVHDNMLPLLDLGDKKYAWMKERFLDAPDKSDHPMPAAQELRAIWQEQVKDMRQQFESLGAEQWLQRHTAVSDADFAMEPHRNKLNIVLTRTTHLFHHIGQLNLLK